MRVRESEMQVSSVPDVSGLWSHDLREPTTKPKALQHDRQWDRSRTV